MAFGTLFYSLFLALTDDAKYGFVFVEIPLFWDL